MQTATITKSAEGVVRRAFTGHTYDEETELLYMGARYYPGITGRFISQDPVYQSVGNSKLIKEKTSLELDEYLKDPQALNSYSYARNNPIRVVDKKENGSKTWLPVDNHLAISKLKLDRQRHK